MVGRTCRGSGGARWGGEGPGWEQGGGRQARRKSKMFQNQNLEKNINNKHQESKSKESLIENKKPGISQQEVQSLPALGRVPRGDTGGQAHLQALRAVRCLVIHVRAASWRKSTWSHPRGRVTH